METQIKVVIGITIGLWIFDADAGGFEKSVLWSGRFAGTAGAGTANARGAESLYFNPAGLAGSDSSEATVGFSPTLSRLRAPVVLAEEKRQADTQFTPMAAAMAEIPLARNGSLGIGAYVAGGNQSHYSDLAVPGFSHRPELRGDIAITELSIGSGYEVFPGLRIGAAWRISHVDATFHAPTVNPGVSLLDLHLDGLSDTKFGGYRLGAQFETLSRDWGVGVQWRSAVHFEAKGRSSGQLEVPGVLNAPITGGDVEADAALPAQLTIGAFHRFGERGPRVHAQYEWSDYHTDRQIDLKGAIGLPTGGSQELSGSPIALGWRNQNVYRVGFEYPTETAVFYRFGYAHSSAVTPKRNALGVFSPPASAQAFAIGVGTEVSPGWEIDSAFEYEFGSGRVEASDGPVAPTLAGDYAFWAATLHLGATHRF